MKYLHIKPGGTLNGSMNVPGDKSITHRSLMMGAIARSRCTVILKNWLQSLDCKATIKCLAAMGVKFSFDADNVQISSVGLNGLNNPDKTLDVENSGTTIRLLTGILVGQKFSSVITGDASICKRPMHRIILPLSLMGAEITAHNDEFAPLQITGGRKLTAIDYIMPIASAQVKSAILLASLYAEDISSVVSPGICRNHTEILLEFFSQASSGASEIVVDIPGDLSSAAFFLVGAAITPGADLTIKNVGINPTRNGIIEILTIMGADITVNNSAVVNGEPRGDLRVRFSQQLQGIVVPPGLIANAIDDLPAICLAAACANGITEIRGAAELRVKESDRLAMLAKGFTSLGIMVNEFADGLEITGGIISGGEVAAGNDHRIAMTFAMAGLVAQQEIIVQDTANIATSFPNFVQLANAAGMLITEEDLCPI